MHPIPQHDHPEIVAQMPPNGGTIADIKADVAVLMERTKEMQSASKSGRQLLYGVMMLLVAAVGVVATLVVNQ